MAIRIFGYREERIREEVGIGKDSRIFRVGNVWLGSWRESFGKEKGRIEKRESKRRVGRKNIAVRFVR